MEDKALATADAEVRFRARMIQDEDHLNQILQTIPNTRLRAAVKAKLVPHLRFTLKEADHGEGKQGRHGEGEIGRGWPGGQ